MRVVQKIHFSAGLLATLTIAAFFLATIVVEVFGSHEAVATVKSLIVMPGLMVLLFLDHWASQGTFDETFYWLQGMELLAGAINLMLMGMNIRDGLRMSGRFHVMLDSNTPR